MARKTPLLCDPASRWRAALRRSSHPDACKPTGHDFNETVRPLRKAIEVSLRVREPRPLCVGASATRNRALSARLALASQAPRLKSVPSIAGKLPEQK